MRALLDVNVLVAILDENHAHHEVVSVCLAANPSHRETRLREVVGHLDRAAARSATALVRVDEVFETDEGGLIRRYSGIESRRISYV